jgi:hypothetical protein
LAAVLTMSSTPWFKVEGENALGGAGEPTPPMGVR